MLGNYAVEMVVDGEAHRQVFKVQDYRKPDYQVQVTPERTRYVAGETVTVTVESRYFFGEPVANAPLEIKIYRLGERWCWEGECPTEEKYVWYASDRPPIQATTDASGRFTFTLTAEYQSDDRWWWPPVRTLWGLEATVDDGSHQTVSHFAVVEVFRTAERLSLDVGGHLHPPGQPFTVQITARTIFDEPVPGRAIRLELARWSLATSDYTDIVQAITLTTRSDGTVSTPSPRRSRAGTGCAPSPPTGWATTSPSPPGWPSLARTGVASRPPVNCASWPTSPNTPRATSPACS